MNLNIIDLFSGVGGLSLGAARAGFNVLGAVEIDKHAVSTHAENFPNTKHFQGDIGALDAKNLLKKLDISKGDVHGIIGGPPCQGFSTIGKRNLEDPRNLLFSDFFRLVADIEPDFFLAENVTGILNEKYNDIRSDALSIVTKKYNLLEPMKVKASDFGAPTIRTRIFFIGFHKKKVRKEIILNINESSDVTVEEALKGLPQLINPEWQKEEDAWQPINKNEFPNTVFYQKVAGEIPKGVGNPLLVKKYLEQNLVSGCHGTRHTKEVIERFSVLKYGQQDSVSKSVRLNPKGYCPTLRAGTGSEKGSFQAVRPIHFKEDRVITPREAARLQGFPDWFVFHKTKWHSFRQIGNSVSPIVAESVLKAIYSILSSDNG